MAEKCRGRSEKRESGSRNEARKEFSDGNVGTLRVFLAAAARGAGASGCRVSVRLVTEYKCEEKNIEGGRGGGVRGVLKWAETREREASSDKAAKRTCKYMRDPKGQPRAGTSPLLKVFPWVGFKASLNAELTHGSSVQTKRRIGDTNHVSVLSDAEVIEAQQGGQTATKALP
ncbi:hypothetical protein K0M31_020095 [Melipona bicolor]|uniref:Uncharacterized protein n=1 Tax=Melipona bicolor TaxID=60889 RepID=A0AA40G0S6_9HYME|nr:hypothetical protein K0M31_020095 [Melipona bicolor]